MGLPNLQDRVRREIGEYTDSRKAEVEVAMFRRTENYGVSIPDIVAGRNKIEQEVRALSVKLETEFHMVGIIGYDDKLI